MGASGRPLSRQTPALLCCSLSARVSVARTSRGAQAMPGGPLVLQGIRTDHINRPAGRGSGLCKSTVTMGGLRPQGQIWYNIWSVVVSRNKNVAIYSIRYPWTL